MLRIKLVVFKIDVRINSIPIAARSTGSSIEWIDMKRWPKLVWSNDECTREAIYLIGFCISIAKPVSWTRHEHIYKITLEYHTTPRLYLAGIDDLSPSSN